MAVVVDPSKTLTAGGGKSKDRLNELPSENLSLTARPKAFSADADTSSALSEVRGQIEPGEDLSDVGAKPGFMRKRGWANGMTAKTALAAFMAVAGAAKTVDADIIVSRDTFGQARTDGGVPSFFGPGNIAYSALGYSPATGYDWTLDTLRFAGVLSLSGTPNVGSMLNQDFLIVDVNDPINFNVNVARTAFLNNQTYQHGTFYLRSAPNNSNYHIPYNTSGTYDLFDLTFSGFSFNMTANQDRYFSLIGLGQGGAGAAGDLGVGVIDQSLYPDRLAISNSFGGYARLNQDHGFSNSYAMTFIGTSVPEPSPLLFIAVAGLGYVLAQRGRREVVFIPPVNASSTNAPRSKL